MYLLITIIITKSLGQTFHRDTYSIECKRHPTKTEVNLTTLKARRFRAYFMEIYKILNGFDRIDEFIFFYRQLHISVSTRVTVSNFLSIDFVMTYLSTASVTELLTNGTVFLIKFYYRNFGHL